MFGTSEKVMGGMVLSATTLNASLWCEEVDKIVENLQGLAGSYSSWQCFVPRMDFF